MSTPVLYELGPDDADVFRDAILDLRMGNPYAASVTVYDTADYADMRLLITDDGRAGIAVRGDEIVSVFARRDSAYPRCGRSLVAVAVEAGGRRLDCFDPALPRIYAAEGFRPVARLKWVDEYAPDGWDYQLYSNYNSGRPDVVFMRYDPARLDSHYQPGEGRYVEDYDAGLEATASD